MSDYVAFPKQHYRDLKSRSRSLSMQIASMDIEADALAGKLACMREKLELADDSIGGRISDILSDRESAQAELEAVMADIADLESQ